MKRFFLLAILCYAFQQIHAQKGNSLFFYTEKKDSLVGVKDNKGRIIIPAVYQNYSGISNHEKIADNETIIVMQRFERFDKKPAVSAGDAFDRAGTFLFHPLTFDNGADYYKEGFTRCVENGKVGFVNEEGQIVIAPQWDWAAPFNYGYSDVCNGCYFDRSKDSEHPPLAFSPDSETYYIDKTGSKVSTLKTAADTLKDFKITDSGYLAYPFKYNHQEQQIVDSFYKIKAISQLANAHYQDNSTSPTIHFEITVRPLPKYPFYQIQGYQNWDKSFYADDDLIFIIDKQGNWFHYEPYGNRKTILKKWLKETKDALK